MNLILTLASAGFLLLAFPRVDVAYLAPVALAPMLVGAARETSAFRRFLNGYAAGVVYWFGICYWIQLVLAEYAGVGNAIGWALFMLFCLIKALHMGAFTALAGITMRAKWALPATAALWVAIELTHGYLGFAWLALGNAGIGMSLPMRLAPITGVYGISFVFAMLSAALALSFLRRPRLQLAWLAALPGLFLLPKMPLRVPGAQSAVLVQPNISEAEQWTAESADRMQQRQIYLSVWAAHALPRPKPELIVWPEVPAPLYYNEDARFRGHVNDMARALNTYVLFGDVGRTPDRQPLNSALLISPAGIEVAQYDKVNLVPFGEFVPWPFGFANKVSTQVGDFVPGHRVVVAAVGDHKIGTFICYESVFPNFVRQFANGGAEALFNLSNDGYFGKTAAREQHLKIVRMRAAENRRWVLRSTNDGITAAIDPAGRVTSRMPLYQEMAARMGFDYVRDKTVYTRYGDWFAYTCAVVAAAALIRAGLPARRRP